MENPIKMDDLGGTTMFGNTRMFQGNWLEFSWNHVFPAQNLTNIFPELVDLS